MATDINCNRQPCYMGGCCFNINGKRRGITTKALRANTKLVDFGKQFFFQFLIKRITVSDIYIAAKRHFRK